jgi:hypothetical protein
MLAAMSDRCAIDRRDQTVTTAVPVPHVDHPFSPPGAGVSAADQAMIECWHGVKDECSLARCPRPARLVQSAALNSARLRRPWRLAKWPASELIVMLTRTPHHSTVSTAGRYKVDCSLGAVCKLTATLHFSLRTLGIPRKTGA